MTEIARAYSIYSNELVCLLHSMQFRSRRFYSALVKNGVEIHFLERRGGKYIERLFGRTALIPVRAEGQIVDIFPELIEQGLGAVYIMSKANAESVLEMQVASQFDIARKIEEDPAHLIYMVDEDAAINSEEIFESARFGAKCKKEFINALNRESAGE